MLLGHGEGDNNKSVSFAKILRDEKFPFILGFQKCVTHLRFCSKFRIDFALKCIKFIINGS